MRAVKKAVIISFMNEDEIIEALDELTYRIHAIRVAVKALSSQHATSFPEFAAEKVGKSICLHCGKKISKSEESTRGLHLRCYKKLKGLISKGEHAESELIDAGKMAPKKQPGRRSEKLELGDIKAKLEREKRGN